MIRMTHSFTGSGAVPCERWSADDHTGHKGGHRMDTHGERGARRRGIAAVATLAVVLSAVGLGLPSTAKAVTLGSLTSRMEVDGDKANAAGLDWNDIQDGTLPGGYLLSPGVPPAGVIPQTYQIDGPSI